MFSFILRRNKVRKPLFDQAFEKVHWFIAFQISQFKLYPRDTGAARSKHCFRHLSP